VQDGSTAKAFLALNRRLESLMPLMTPLGVALGMLLSYRLNPLRPLVPWLFGIMTFSGAVKLRAREIALTAKEPVPVLLFFICTHAVMPVGVWALARLINPGAPAIVAGFVLLYAIPTAVSGFIWVSIFRGDGALSLTLILLDSLTAPFVVPATVSWLLGTGIAIDATGMALSIAAMIVLPTILAVSLNEATRGGAPKVLSPYLSVVSKLCLISVVALNAAAIAPRLNLAEPGVWLIAVQSLAFGFCGFLLGRLAGFIGRRDREQTKTLLFSVGLRNISGAATLAIAFFPEEAAVPAIIGMVFQQTLASIAGRALLGPPSDESTTSAQQGVQR